MTNEAFRYEPIDRRSAVVVIVGGCLVAAAIGLLVLARDRSMPGLDADLPARFPLALFAAGIGFSLVAVALSRQAMRLSPHQLPRPALSLAIVVLGLIGLFHARSVFDWPLYHLPDDARSQPANVLAAALFFAGWAAMFTVVGAMLLYARFRSVPDRRDIRPH
jgi:hypothetical protein